MSEAADPAITILVVDDAREARNILVRLLALEGFESIQAANGREALDMLDDFVPDLILLDVMMPEMNGLETLQHIRERFPASQLPVIMVTALGSAQDVVRGLELGANDYITKPPQFEVLAARVRTQMHIKALEDQSRRNIAQLEAMSALKDKFLQIAAHDLRNPLNNITFGIEMIERYLADGEIDGAQELIGTIRVASRMMAGIINDFLDLGALQEGELQLRIDLMNLNETLQNVVEQYMAQAKGKSVSLRWQPDPALTQIWGDADRLAQVTSNLVSNAVKFCSAGDRVVVRTRADGDSAWVEVGDTGPGIPGAELPMLFQEFARLSNVPTGGERSSGVGLSIARRMVELHGGEIGARSKVGSGSVFWVRLPVNGAGTQ